MHLAPAYRCDARPLWTGLPGWSVPARLRGTLLRTWVKGVCASNTVEQQALLLCAFLSSCCNFPGAAAVDHANGQIRTSVTLTCPHSTGLSCASIPTLSEQCRRPYRPCAALPLLAFSQEARGGVLAPASAAAPVATAVRAGRLTSFAFCPYMLALDW